MRAGAIVLVAALAGGQGLAAPPASSRAELDALQAAVDAAVSRVSRPSGLTFGRASGAYHLPGYGAFVVLAPRALPRAPRQAAGESRAFADLVRRLEESIAEVRDPAERRRLQETVAALRAGGPPPPAPRRARSPRDPALMQEMAEAFRRDAELAMARAEHDVLVRLSMPADSDLGPMGDPDPVVAPFPPTPPRPTPRRPSMPPAAAVPPTPPAPPVPVLAPPPFPRWHFEHEAFAEDFTPARPPERVIADVRRAIVTGLGAYRGGLALVGADEFVVVAVDFVPRVDDRARPRTVVARARKRDLLEHRAGRLTAEALHARVAFDEY